MAGSLTRRAFSMVVFLTFLHPDCSKRSFSQRRPVDNSGLKEHLKCDTKQINKEDSLFQFTGIFELDARQDSPIDKIVPAGTNFTYQCCGENGFKAIFKWGIYEQGIVSPSSLFSRVEVNIAGNFCSVSWTSDFQASRYVGRTSVEYNTSSQCVLWVISNVTKEDENTFVGVYRDNFTLGIPFKDCTPVSLNVSKAATPNRPLTQTTQRPAVKTPRQKASSTAAELSTTTLSKHPSHTPTGPSLSNKKTTDIPWIAIAIGLIIALAILSIIIYAVKQCQWRRWTETEYQITIGEEDGIDDNML